MSGTMKIMEWSHPDPLGIPQTAQSLHCLAFNPHAAKTVFNVLLKYRSLTIVKSATRQSLRPTFPDRLPTEDDTNDGRATHVHSNMAAARGKQIISSKNANFNLKRNQ